MKRHLIDHHPRLLSMRHQQTILTREECLRSQLIDTVLQSILSRLSGNFSDFLLFLVQLLLQRLCHGIFSHTVMDVTEQWMLLLDALISYFDFLIIHVCYSFQIIVLGINLICGGKARFLLLNEQQSLVLICLFSCHIIY